MYEKNKLKTLNLQNFAFQFSWSAPITICFFQQTLNHLDTLIFVDKEKKNLNKDVDFAKYTNYLFAFLTLRYGEIKKILWALVDMFRFDGFRSGQTTSWLVLLADIVFLTLIYIGHVLYAIFFSNITYQLITFGKRLMRNLRTFGYCYFASSYLDAIVQSSW
ncbi:hypothetical protein T02_2129 [Trichinella nativa]|uniref:Uncharacterized protein n=1 Tax=Trichinella nativa TaxID=6335 RepID=A0A0V1KNU3_9BILA|nr:hypothetical protein T02_2129 [Trichinella nativa]